MNEPLPPNNNNLPPQNITVNQMSRSTPVLGILSIVFGGLSMVPLLGVVSVLGLILGVFSLLKKQFITGVIGTSLSGVGIATSPILWALVICTVNPASDMCQKKDAAAPSGVQVQGEAVPAKENNGQPAAPQVPLVAPADPLPLAPAAAPAQPAAPATEQAPSAPAAEAPVQPQAMPDAAAVPPQGQAAPAAPVEQAPAAPAAEQVPTPVPEQPAAQPVAEPAAAQ